MRQALDALAVVIRCGRVPGRPRRIRVPGCHVASTLALIEVVEELDALAPLHNRRAAAVMRAGLASLPDVAHVACFDTAFHATLPEEAWRYPLPADWVDRFGIRRFGFHGLSVAWSIDAAAVLLGRPVPELGAGRRASRVRLLGHRRAGRTLGRHVDGHDAATRA